MVKKSTKWRWNLQSEVRLWAECDFFKLVLSNSRGVLDGGLDILHRWDAEVFFLWGLRLGVQSLSEASALLRYNTSASRSLQIQLFMHLLSFVPVLHFTHLVYLLFACALSCLHVYLLSSQRNFCIYDSVIQAYQRSTFATPVFPPYFGLSILPRDTGVSSSMFTLRPSSIKGRTLDTGGFAEWLPFSFPCTLANRDNPLHRDKSGLETIHSLIKYVEGVVWHFFFLAETSRRKSIIMSVCKIDKCLLA